jgi:hypothetical protein
VSIAAVTPGGKPFAGGYWYVAADLGQQLSDIDRAAHHVGRSDRVGPGSIDARRRVDHKNRLARFRLALEPLLHRQRAICVAEPEIDDGELLGVVLVDLLDTDVPHIK